MNLAEIEQHVTELDTRRGFDLIYDLLLAYGLPKASIARLRNGSHNRSDREDECLWRNKAYYRFIQNGDDLHDVIDDASKDPRILKERPRFLIVRDSARLLAIDTRSKATLETALVDLPNYFEFFLAWAGIEKTQLENLNYADVKAAEKMARLYDEIIKHNRITTASDVHHLNVFFSRLLFCFFAEDTRVFEPGQFTNAIASSTNANGEDVHTLLDDLFKVLNTEVSVRGDLPLRFRDFGYVNGNLFNQQAACPTFSAKARRIVLECGTLDWSQINPDIFGSMIQAVVHPSQRESLGMHYTSVENIMKVTRPLFLEELHEAFEVATDSPQKLQRLLSRISEIKIFDPACGSGNFLVIAYKELRKLEHRILQRVIDLNPSAKGLFSLSKIKLENFYGIEIDDFAHEIAILSLWLAKHQMNLEFQELFGVEISLIPLKDTGNVVCGNATRIRWTDVIKTDDGDELYVIGNPPYLGSRNQKPEHKADLKLHHPRYKSLDYVCSWIILSAQLVSTGKATAAGLVTTNSVTQGEQVGILWPGILASGVELAFAYRSFKWSNDAKGGAGVTCVVLGLRRPPIKQKRVFADGTVTAVRNISPYLTDSSNATVTRASRPISPSMPTMTYGCLPNDGGNLLMNNAERSTLLVKRPKAAEYIKPFLGASEFLEGQSRWCLYITDEQLQDATTIPEIQSRLDRVRQHRERSSEASTRKLAAFPNRFYFSCYREGPCLIVPSTTSERRPYIPVGILPTGTVVSNLANAVYSAEPWVFGLIQSRMHMAWMRAVAGRLETRYRYSAALVYNTFPVPQIGDNEKLSITETVHSVLDAREQFSDRTIAELYDPKKMPQVLKNAHTRLDEIVDGVYGKHDCNSDEERLVLLFDMYAQLTSGRNKVPTVA
jgi:hypothetical protein